jgi:competence protein ComK
MLEKYEINYNTLAIVPINTRVSKVIEKERTYIVNKKSIEIIDESCRFFGSTFDGRHQGTKEMIGITYKSPIIIEESQGIIFFPTSSPRYNNCFWLALNKIKSSKKNANFCQVILCNDIT